MKRSGDVAQQMPLLLTLFVGRQDELRRISELINNPTCRLLTLVGPGGIGKTRLALEAARQFPEAHFVSLQPLTSPDFTVSAIASALGFQFYSGADPKQQLLDFLREKSWLLVLDNFEHLLDGATLLSEMLAAAPALRLLVTSRERLNLVEEWVLEVGGLTYPTSGTDANLERYSAVELFVQHARRVQVNFKLMEAQRPEIVRICRLVGGMPLGIELAASWVRALSCEALADEIERSLDILETPARNVEPRHRTMRAAFEPMWARLTEHECDVFMKLSMFRGGFTREAAEQVAGASLWTLTALVDKSLLRVDANGRYDMHELLRQYAAEKLDEAGEADTTSQYYLDYFLKFAEQVEAHNFGREQIVWYDRAEVELDNVRAALHWSSETQTGLRIIAALGWFFGERGHWIEGLDWSEQAIAANPDAPISLRAQALQNTIPLAGRLGESEKVKVFGEQALALARSINDRWNIAWTLSHLAQFSYDEAVAVIPIFDESLALFRALDDPMGITHNLGRRLYCDIQLGNYAAARPLTEDVLSRARAAGDLIMEGFGEGQLGEYSLDEGNIEQAKMHFRRCLSLWDTAHFAAMGHSLMLAVIETVTGHLEQAEILCREFLLHPRQHQVRQGHLDTSLVLILASVAKRRGQFEHAARLIGAGNIRDPGEVEKRFSIVRLLRGEVEAVHMQLGEAAYTEAWAAGNAMTLHEAQAYALTGMGVPNETTLSESANQALTDPLTGRELEILYLLVRGLTNPEIATALTLSVGTVKAHSNHIFGKLGVSNRVQAVNRTRELHLV